jgi:SAM-dependent methyltransferase
MADLRSVVDYHGRMLADRARLQQFERAIVAVVRPGAVVADLGCGTGILSLLCCRAGARRVYAMEVGPIARWTERIIAANGFASRVEVLRGLSTEISLPERVDVIVSETLGGAAFDEGIVGYVADARRRFLAPGGVIIPRRVTLWVAPVSDAALHRRLVGSWRQPVRGFDVSPLQPIAARQLHLAPITPAHLCAPAQAVAAVDLDRAEELFIAGRAEFALEREGPVSGFAVGFDADLGEGIELSNRPPSAATHWPQGFLALEEPLPGGAVKVEVGTRDGQTWRWRGRVGKHPFDLDTLAGRAPTRAELEGDQARPTLGRTGPLAAATLAMIDGKRTIADIAQAVWQSPAALPSEAATRAFVERLARELGG